MQEITITSVSLTFLLWFENRVLRRIFGPKREEDGSWRKLHEEDEIGGTRSTHGEGEECLQGFGWEARREETTGKTRCRWEDNIKIDLMEMGISGVNWIQLAQDRVQWQVFVNMVWVP
jgi:hypothetical protein